MNGMTETRAELLGCGVRVFPHTADPAAGEETYRRHLRRLLHTKPDDPGILYPPPDLTDLRELFAGQTVFIDTATTSSDDISGDLIRLLPEIGRRHSIEDRAAFILLEGDIGLPQADDTARALGDVCSADVLPVAFYDSGFSDRVNVSLWWFERTSGGREEAAKK